MRKSHLFTVAGFALVAILLSDARADPEECGLAVDQYNSAIGDVSDALRLYGRCVADSRGHDDCSIEFSNLRSAQDDFETAVSNYGMECN